MGVPIAFSRRFVAPASFGMVLNPGQRFDVAVALPLIAAEFGTTPGHTGLFGYRGGACFSGCRATPRALEEVIGVRRSPCVSAGQ